MMDEFGSVWSGKDVVYFMVLFQHLWSQFWGNHEINTTAQNSESV